MPRNPRRATDEYAWLSESASPRVLSHLRAEQARTLEAMGPTRALEQRLLAELEARLVERDQSVPARFGPYEYYTRTEPAAQHVIHCRRPVGGGPEQIVLDENAVAGASPHFGLGGYQIGGDHGTLAFAVDLRGDERYVLHLRDLASGDDVEPPIPGVAGDLAWSSDGGTVFYVVADETRRPSKLMRHRVGQDPERDRCVIEEPDLAFYMSLHRSRSGRYLFVRLESLSTDEVLVLDPADPARPPRVILPRRRGRKYTVSHSGDHLYVIADDGRPGSRLLRIRPGDESLRRAEQLIAHRGDISLDGIDAFARHLVVHGRCEGIPFLEILRLADGHRREVAFPEPGYALRLGTNPEYDTDTLRLHHSSLTTPAVVLECDMNDGILVERKRELVPGYRPSDYIASTAFATAPDGTRIPISLVHRRDLARTGRNPAFLVGYGAYGSIRDPRFSATRLPLLERGFVYAIAHVRGGGKLGRRWYDAGKLLSKKNTFTDFIACAEHLISEGFTCPEKLAIKGESAGGLLVGAVVNMRPDLFQAVVADVPFVDVVNTMLDPTIPRTVIEYEEWGDPRDRQHDQYIRSYSPYDNVQRQRYPHMLVTAAMNDSRVPYWEPAKWVARLRERKTDDNVLLLKVDFDAGHFGRSGRHEHLAEVAFEQAFILRCIAADEAPPRS